MKKENVYDIKIRTFIIYYFGVFIITVEINIIYTFLFI